MYQDPIIQAYVDLIKAKAGGAIKTYHQGEPTRLAASDLPCAIISKRQTRIGFHSNSEDEHGIGMSITIITDVRQDLTSESGSQNAVAGISTLYDIIEGRDADFKLKDSSLLDILRTNQLVNATYGLRTDLSTVTVADYGLTLRDRAPEAWSIEARVDIVCSFHQVR
jgi:hypothetical protein